MLWFSFKLALIEIFLWQLLSVLFILTTSRTHAYFIISCYTRFVCTSSAFWYYSVSKNTFWKLRG